MNKFSNFLKATTGNVALTFALAAVPLLGVTGMALDYSKASKTQAVLQRAVDNATLAAWAGKTISDDKLEKIIKAYMIKNGVTETLVGKVRVKIKRNGDSKLKVSARGKIDAGFMSVLGFKRLKITAKSTVVRDFRNIEVALVLDNTGSMAANNKLISLKKAAKVLVNQLHDKKAPSTDLKFAIVPFSQYVNVGTSNRNKTWMDVPEDSETRTTVTRDVTEKVEGSERNCGMRAWTSNNDGVVTTGSTYQCDYDYITTGTRDYEEVKSTKWYGCAGSRDYPLNVTDVKPGKKIPGIMNVVCARSLTELTDSRSQIINEIDSLVATGDTYMPAGLIWGWRVLSGAQPFASGVSYNKMSRKNYTKAIVLMTDGINTYMPTYPDHVNDGGDQKKSNKLTAELCENIKNSGDNAKENIVVYAVTFEVLDPVVKKLLKKCATSKEHYFDAENGEALTAAFEGIARSLVTLRVSK